MTYDAAGNLTSDGLYNYAYDAEGHQTSAAGVTYTYDGLGRRVEKSNGTLYWFDGGGSVLSETDLSGGNLNDYVFFGGWRMARVSQPDGMVYHSFPDALGTSRVIVHYGQGAACYDADLYPYGGERVVTNTCPQNYKFTGMERDAESGNDHTMFRQYMPNFGRWMTPDPLGGDVTNPQSLNRYAYVLNNPINLVDLLGLCGTGGNDPPCPDNNTTTVTVNGNGAQAPTTACQMAGDGGASCQTALDAAEAAAAQAAAHASGTSGTQSGTTGVTTHGLDNRQNCIGTFADSLFDGNKPPNDEAVKTIAEGGEAYFSLAAVKHAATAISVNGNPGLIVPMRSSIVRGLVSFSEAFGAIAQVAPLAFVTYDVLKADYETAVANYKGQCRAGLRYFWNP